MGSQSAKASEDEKASEKAIAQLRDIYWWNHLDRRHEKRREQDIMRQKLRERLSAERKDMLFVGDALFKGGNDYIMKSTGIRCISVSGPKETKKLIRRIIQAPLLDKGQSS